MTSKGNIKVSPKEEQDFGPEARKALEREGFSLEVVESKGCFVLKDDTEFKRLLKHSALFATEAPLQFTEDGLKCAWLDAATVALGRWTISSKDLSSYEQRNEPLAPMEFLRLAEILVDRPSGADTEVLFEEPDQHISVSMKGSGASRSFNVPFPEDPLRDKRDIPNPDKFPDPTVGIVDSQTLYEEIKSAEKHFESVVLTLHPEGTLNISAEADTDLSLDVDIPADIKIAGDKPAVSRFSAEYLRKFFHGNRGLQYFSEDVELMLSTDHPLTLTVDWGEHSQYTIVLAPRIEND